MGVSIPKGEATNALKRIEEMIEKEFQSPKGRLQTMMGKVVKSGYIRSFNPQRGGYKRHDWVFSSAVVFVSIPKGEATNTLPRSKQIVLISVSIPKGEATN